MKFIVSFLMAALFIQTAEGRIRNRKVKEAPRACKLMTEDSFLSRTDKKVLGTLRHSVIIEDSADTKTVTLVKDKGEKLCQWKLEQWESIRGENKLPEVKSFKFHIDEYKEILYPHVKKADASYFMMSIPFKSCDLSTQSTKVKLELPKCEPPKKKSRKRSSSSKKKKSTKK